jgi:hypothetical protein
LPRRPTGDWGVEVHYIWIIASLGILFPSATVRGQPDATWTQLEEVNGVLLFQRTEADRSLLSICGQTTIRSSVSDILAVLKDNTRASTWMPYVAEKRDIRSNGDNERIEYTHIDMPWPLRDRYFINRGKLLQNSDGSVTIHVESVDDPIDLDEQKIRGWMYFSLITLQPISNFETRVTIEVNSDPKGFIPKWIVNLAQRDWPVGFFDGLKRELERNQQLHPPDSLDRSIVTGSSRSK